MRCHLFFGPGFWTLRAVQIFLPGFRIRGENLRLINHNGSADLHTPIHPPPWIIHIISCRACFQTICSRLPNSSSILHLHCKGVVAHFFHCLLWQFCYRELWNSLKQETMRYLPKVKLISCSAEPGCQDLPGALFTCVLKYTQLYTIEIQRSQSNVLLLN